MSSHRTIVLRSFAPLQNPDHSAYTFRDLELKLGEGCIVCLDASINSYVYRLEHREDMKANELAKLPLESISIHSCASPLWNDNTHSWMS